MRDLPQKPLEAHDAGIAKLRRSLCATSATPSTADGVTYKIWPFIMNVFTSPDQAELPRSGLAGTVSRPSYVEGHDRLPRSPRVLLSGLLAVVPLAPGATNHW